MGFKWMSGFQLCISNITTSADSLSTCYIIHCLWRVCLWVALVTVLQCCSAQGESLFKWPNYNGAPYCKVCFHMNQSCPHYCDWSQRINLKMCTNSGSSYIINWSQSKVPYVPELALYFKLILFHISASWNKWKLTALRSWIVAARVCKGALEIEASLCDKKRRWV